MLVKTLNKNILLSDLHKLDIKQPGILTTFWRYFYKTQPNFCLWLDFMEKKDPGWQEYIENWRTSKENKPLQSLQQSNIVISDEEDNLVENELSIKDRIAQIREKYGNID